MLALPLIAAAIVGLSACSSQNPGSPQANGSASSASQPTSSSSTSGASPLASVDPCTLITQTQVTNNGLLPGKSVNAPGGRACRWVRSDSGTATVDGYDIQVVIYDTTGIDQLNTVGGTVSDISVGKYQSKLFQDNSDNDCLVSVPTAGSSRVDIGVVSSLGITQGCKLVQQVAPKVVANFPA
jgi:hypothetical protein